MTGKRVDRELTELERQTKNLLADIDRSLRLARESVRGARLLTGAPEPAALRANSPEASAGA